MLLAPIGALASSSASFADRVGDTYEIRLQSESAITGSGSTGSSHDVWTLTERVVALRDGGSELQFDLPPDTSAEERTQAWQFPARVFRPAQGPLVLLNASDAERRLHAWLSEQELRLCGHWVFGWTAQYFDCDPQSVLAMLAPYLEPANIREGALYNESSALEPVPLRITERSSNGPVLVARLEIDPNTIRHQRAEGDVAVAEMTGHPPVSLDTALQAHASERVSGTIVTTFETDLTGRVTRRTRVTQIDTSKPDGTTEHRTTTETTDWALSSASATPAPH
jgi:hypothetical protein